MAIGPPPKEPRNPNDALGDVDLAEIDDLFSDAAFESPPPEPPPPPPPAADDYLDPPEPPATDMAAAPEPPPEEPIFEEPVAEPEPAAPAEPAYSAEPGIFDSKTTFRAEAQRLSRARDFAQLAAITSAALDTPWAQSPETRTALLAELARIYRDRLKDAPSAEDTLIRLLEVDPGHGEAIQFLARRFEERSDWRALYDLRVRALEATLDPAQRLEWTREAADLATKRLGSLDLAIEAWEQLWRLGDAVEETARELSQAYRRSGRWDAIAEFLARRAAQESGSHRVVLLREVAEASLSALRDHDRASKVLAQILAERPNDPIALLGLARVHYRRKQWDALSALVDQAEHVHPAALSDLCRLVADALWTADEPERAVAVYDRLLALHPDDADAVKAKEEFLTSAGRVEELVEFFGKRAEATATVEERAQLLERAAQLAEQQLGQPRLAITLLERRAEIPSVRMESLQALVPLYESLGDHNGLRKALEGQLALTRHPGARIDLLRRLGEHCAHRQGDDARAEAAWREILAAVPDDREIRDELVALYRRRGDFEAVERALSAYAWRPLDDATLLGVWRSAAQNLDEHIRDPERAVAAWLRVTDLAPGDPDALHALAGHQRALGRKRPLVAALEAELAVATDEDRRVALAMEIANLWEEEGEPAAAISAYERVLRWRPSQTAALDALIRLRAGTDRGATQGALDAALAVLDPARDGEERLRRVRAGVDLLAGDDKLGRFFALRRKLILSGRDPALVDEVAAAARDADASKELVGLYLDLVAEARDPALRDQYTRALAAVYEERLQDSSRAFLALQAARQPPIEDLKELDALGRLANATNRHEDLLALLDVATRESSPPKVRRAALRRRLAICDHKATDPERAFQEAVRWLRLDPDDEQALAEAKKFGEAGKLWRALDALYAELSDRAPTNDARVKLARARHALATEHLNDANVALDHLLLLYRLEPSSEVEEQLLKAAEAQRAWDRVLPLVEANVRSRPLSVDALLKLARLHEEKRQDAERALELHAQAFILDGAAELQPALERLAAATGRTDVLAATYRSAAARSANPMRTLELYGRAATLYAERNQSALALDLHRRILQIQPSTLTSLEVVIAHQRMAGLWRELCDSLQSSLQISPENGARRLERQLEIADLSRAKLSDPETALATYARILDAEPQNQEASAGVRALTEGPIDATLELRRIRLELEREKGPRRVELQLKCATLQEKDLDDSAGAIESLRALVEESGAAGPGFERLSTLLRQRESWTELVDLLDARARALGDAKERVAALEEAIGLCDRHSAIPSDRRERLCRALLDERPQDAEARRRLLTHYRAAGRLDEVAAQLRLMRAALPADATDERTLIESELVRILDGLGKGDEAEALLVEVLQRNPDDAEALLASASIKLRKGDVASYLALRERHAKGLSPEMGALVLCHLAEVCDERGQEQSKSVAYYRNARALDGANQPAMEALKAIGRRVKSWRSAAALLPDPDERQLSPSERADRLRARGDAEKNPAAVAGWYERAVAVHPDDAASWDALARVFEKDGDQARALSAHRASLAAFERSTTPDPAHLDAHARRIEELAVALRASGDSEHAAHLSWRAYEFYPALPSAALDVAEHYLKDGDSARAYAIYDRLLAVPSSLSKQQHILACLRRGTLAAKLGRVDQAIADLRDGLRLEELNSELLRSLADALVQKGRVAAAVQHYTQALLLAWEDSVRGQLYARLGRLWEDRFAALDEAGACYDMAIAAGTDESDLMTRALAHYRRSGKTERALEVIEQLVPKTTEVAALASLWAERGGILAQSNGQGAMEAFDMALSYDPSCAPAVAGLCSLLEKRGEWKQLVEMLEVRIDSGTVDERADAARRLARISEEQLKDRVRTERFLRAALDLQPRREEFERLIALLNSPARAEDRQEAIAGMLALGGPRLPTLIDLARQLHAEGRRHWAWCLLSVLMNCNVSDPALRTMLSELRKDFDKHENVSALSPETRFSVRSGRVPEALYEVLAELDALVAFGPTTPESAGAIGLGRFDTRTATGKTFAAVAEQLGMPDAVLLRAQEMPHAYQVLDADSPQIVVRTDLLQLLSPAETNALFAMVLEQARPGARLLCALPDGDDARLVRALLGTCAMMPRSNDPFVSAIVAGVDENRRATWREKLAPIEPLLESGIDVATLARQEVVECSQRVALAAAADLRFATKLLTRIDASLPKMPSAGKLEDMEEFLGAPALGSLAGFAASPRFGALVAG